MNSFHRTGMRFACTLASAALLLAASLPCLAISPPTTKTWTGAGTDFNWSTAANWSPAGAPVAGNALVFPDSAARKIINNDTAAGTTYRSISITGPASGYEILGNAIALSSGITADNNTGFAANRIEFAITLTASQTFTVSGQYLSLDAPINLGSNTLTLSTAASPVGVIQFDAINGGTGGVTANGSGQVSIGANCSYSGPTTINGGTFLVGGVGGGLNSAGTVTVSGGTLLLANSVSAGSVTVANGATLSLAGANEIAHVANLTMQTGSAFLAGDHGQLVVSNSVTLNTPTLVLSWWSYTSTPGARYRIINKTSAGAITGTFAGQPEGSRFVSNGLSFIISYVGGDGNDVVLTEPAILSPILYLLLD